MVSFIYSYESDALMRIYDATELTTIIYYLGNTILKLLMIYYILHNIKFKSYEAI